MNPGRVRTHNFSEAVLHSLEPRGHFSLDEKLGTGKCKLQHHECEQQEATILASTSISDLHKLSQKVDCQ